MLINKNFCDECEIGLTPESYTWVSAETGHVEKDGIDIGQSCDLCKECYNKQNNLKHIKFIFQIYK